MVGRWLEGGREVVGRWSQVVGRWSGGGRGGRRWSESGRKVDGGLSEVVGAWSEGGRKLVGGGRLVVVWRLQPGSKGGTVGASRISVFGSCSAILHVIWCLSTVYILSDQQAARISHLEIQHGEGNHQSNIVG